MEEDIKDIEKYIIFARESENFRDDADWNWNKDLANEIERILSDYKRVLEMNEVLLKENETLKNKLSLKHFDINVVYNDYLEKLNEYKENSIPIQKIKDKIKKLNDESHAEELEDIMIGDNYTITELVQYVLQELIEER